MIRAEDFDEAFRLRNPGLRSRRRAVELAIDRGEVTSLDELLRLGELFFVVDGHHRISIGRERGLVSLPARVRWLCTTAYGMACLRTGILRANRRNVGSYSGSLSTTTYARNCGSTTRPNGSDWRTLPRPGLRTLCPADASHPEQLAKWEREVQPLVRTLRHGGVGEGLRDIELYAHALALRDRRGTDWWPPPSR